MGAACLLAVALVSAYLHYARKIDARLAAGPFADTSNVYAIQQSLGRGERLSPSGIASLLEQCGYAPGRGGPSGSFVLRPAGVDLFPSKAQPVRIECKADKIARILKLNGGQELGEYELPPRLLANIAANRERRRLLRFGELPKVLVQAVLAAEDKRFFEHGAFDTLRMLKAAYVDFKQGRKEQGASTLTMQLARSLWLDPAKNWRRKFAEMLITEHLEQKLSKQQIFEDYANEVYLGRHRTYSIHGFGEAADEYFGKDVRQLTLDEAATLAGLIQRPGYFNPFRYPARARERRNLVLSMMRQDGFISPQQYEAAVQAPLNMASPASKPGAAPYFMDLLSGELQARFQDVEAHDVYTTLDPDLEGDAVEAVHAGLKKVDAALRRQAKKGAQVDQPQVALVALDPHTGEVRALVGGTDYARSQLNRALALRQPGSAFKPFVYAAALNTGLGGSGTVFTPASVIDDEPTTFWFGDEPYEPSDFHDDFSGQVTLRQALARSVNVASVNLAQAIGYRTVARLARQVGLKSVQGTPAAALGAYEVTPLALAGAYTVFANQGVYVKPELISEVRDEDGRVVYSDPPDTRHVLDPRVAWLMVNMMEDVLRSGTGASARAQGFAAPAAGKTGTLRDGWFAGFTSQLLCVVWVGYDDGHDLNLEGAKSALPIWTEFMKRALKHPRYADPQAFRPPAGIVSVEIDPDSGLLATPECPDARMEYFLTGTQPMDSCPLHNQPQPLATSSPLASPASSTVAPPQ